MKILIIGNLGSTGKRYSKILDEMGHEVLGYDLCDIEAGRLPPKCDKAIIASPTFTHFQYASIFQDEGTDYLVEKPAAHTIQCCELMTGKMVCNWAFVFPDHVMKPGKNDVFYDYTETGKEGFWFDTCQLHILSNGRGRINNNSSTPIFVINGLTVTKVMIEASYYRMLDAWLYHPDEVWDVQDLIPELSYIIRKQEIENGYV